VTIGSGLRASGSRICAHSRGGGRAKNKSAAVRARPATAVTVLPVARASVRRSGSCWRRPGPQAVWRRPSPGGRPVPRSAAPALGIRRMDATVTTVAARQRHVPRTCALPLHAAAELQAQRWSRWVLAAGRPARRPGPLEDAKPPSCFECRSTHTSELLRKCHTRISAEFGIRHAACHGK
jgi:hypothetical protein